MASSRKFMGLSFCGWAVSLLLTEVAAIFLFLSYDQLRNTYLHERRQVVSQLGEEAFAEIEQKSSTWFRHLVVDTGILDGSYSICARQGKDKFDDRGLGDWFAYRLDVTWLAIQEMFFRFAAIRVWVPFVMVMLVPIFGDGWCMREIRKNRFAAASPAYCGYSKYLLYAVVLGIILAPLLPAAMNPVYVPIGLAMCGVALWVGMVYRHKRM